MIDIEAVIQRRMQELGYELCDEDYNLLVQTMEYIVPEMIDKFIKGAKEHPKPLIEKVTTKDILMESIDGIFYSMALNKRHHV